MLAAGGYAALVPYPLVWAHVGENGPSRAFAYVALDENPLEAGRGTAAGRPEFERLGAVMNVVVAYRHVRPAAVMPGPYELSYAVAAGLGGKAKAVGPGDAQPRGSLKGTIAEKPPVSRVAADGTTVISPAP